MESVKKIEWVLRIAVAGEFLGHGVFGLQGKEEWIGWIQQITGANPELSSQLLFWVGILDLVVAFFVLVKPLRMVLLWATIWAFWAVTLRLVVGEPILEFIERFANWGAPLALLLLRGFPKSSKELFS